MIAKNRAAAGTARRSAARRARFAANNILVRRWHLRRPSRHSRRAGLRHRRLRSCDGRAPAFVTRNLVEQSSAPYQCNYGTGGQRSERAASAALIELVGGFEAGVVFAWIPPLSVVAGESAARRDPGREAAINTIDSDQRSPRCAGSSAILQRTRYARPGYARRSTRAEPRWRRVEHQDEWRALCHF